MFGFKCAHEANAAQDSPLEVPPVGYEWVRDGADAILVNTSTGEIPQMKYGVFA